MQEKKQLAISIDLVANQVVYLNSCGLSTKEESSLAGIAAFHISKKNSAGGISLADREQK